MDAIFLCLISVDLEVGSGTGQCNIPVVVHLKMQYVWANTNIFFGVLLLCKYLQIYLLICGEDVGWEASVDPRSQMSE